MALWRTGGRRHGFGLGKVNWRHRRASANMLGLLSLLLLCIVALLVHALGSALIVVRRGAWLVLVGQRLCLRIIGLGFCSVLWRGGLVVVLVGAHPVMCFISNVLNILSLAVVGKRSR